MQKHINFEKGEQIEVTGSRVKFGDSDALIAREIKKGGQTRTLRNAQGTLSGLRRRRPR